MWVGQLLKLLSGVAELIWSADEKKPLKTSHKTILFFFFFVFFSFENSLSLWMIHVLECVKLQRKIKLDTFSCENRKLLLWSYFIVIFFLLIFCVLCVFELLWLWHKSDRQMNSFSSSVCFRRITCESSIFRNSKQRNVGLMRRTVVVVASQRQFFPDATLVVGHLIFSLHIKFLFSVSDVVDANASSIG